jgi:hypothetical protein
MTVSELIERLNKYPPNLEVLFYEDWDYFDDFYIKHIYQRYSNVVESEAVILSFHEEQ